MAAQSTAAAQFGVEIVGGGRAVLGVRGQAARQQGVKSAVAGQFLLEEFLNACRGEVGVPVTGRAPPVRASTRITARE